MSYVKVDFDVDKKRIIKEIIRRQNGSRKQAVRETIQNAIDSGADEIEIIIRKNSFLCRDNGTGMNKKIIMNEFRTLGRTTKGEDDIGEFGIGITQLPNFGNVVCLTQDWAIFINLSESDDEFTFSLRQRDQWVDGTIVYCYWDKWMDSFDISWMKESIEKRILPRKDCTIEINGVEHSMSCVDVIEEVEGGKYYAFNYPYTSKYYFVKGIRVEKFDSNFDYCINTEKKLNINFARNEIQDYGYLKQLKRTVENELTKEKEYYNNEEARKIIKLIAKDELDAESVRGKELIPRANKGKLKLSEINGKTLYEGEGNRVTDELEQKGFTIIEEGLLTYVKTIAKKYNFDTEFGRLEDIKSAARRGRFTEYDKEEEKERLDEEQLKKIDLVREINKAVFDMKREILSGEQCSSTAWTDGRSFICFDKDWDYDCNDETDRKLKIFQVLCHEYAHNEESKETDRHSTRFYEKYHELTRDKRHKIAKLL